MSDMYETRKNRLLDIYGRSSPPDPGEYMLLLERVQEVLDNENAQIRPPDSSGLPGGLVLLKKRVPAIIVPDLHARMNFFLSTLLYDEDGQSVLELLEQDELQIVCVGDGFHAEGRARERWALAFGEYQKGFKRHRHMDEEMRESLGVMEMVMEAKCWFPDNFHFLKGNHENIANEEGEGNHPFRKFSYEGIMVLDWVRRFCGEEFLSSYYEFEKSLPLLAVGDNFLVSHAEPLHFFDREKVIEYRQLPDVIEGLIWTANDDSEPGSVEEMIAYYLECEEGEDCYYFGGHRPVQGLYNPRADGKYIQIHNPNRFVVARIDGGGPVSLEGDIIEIENSIDGTIA